jgi:predicted ATP-grasp superfamily ATP-dependent carboligase
VGEYLSAGGGREGGATVPAELLEAGLRMRDALLGDLQAWAAADPGGGLAIAYAQGPGPVSGVLPEVPPGGLPAAGLGGPQGVSPARASIPPPGPAPAGDRATPGAGTPRAVAPRPDEATLNFLAREALSHDLAWLVAPESGGALEALARAVGPRRWIGCTPDAIRLAGRKRATLERLAARGIATPLAFEAGAASPSLTGLPGHDALRAWVVKPDDGAGTTDTRRHVTLAAAEADLAARGRRGEPATLEPWVEGEALSLSLLCREGAPPELLAINRQRIEADASGLLHDEGVVICQMALKDPRAAALRALAGEVAAAVPGLRGFVGIDLVWHPQRGPVVIEINPRLTCAFVGLSAALGRNLAGEILTAHREPCHATA